MVYLNNSEDIFKTTAMREKYAVSSDMNSNTFGSLNKKLKLKENDITENNCVDRKNGRYPNCLQNLKYYLWEFCEKTSIHGFNYLGERNRAISERICWLFAITVALYLCTTLIMSAYQKWVNSPVVVTFATTQTPVWKVPFPSVTICPEVKSRRRRFNYTDVYMKKLTNQSLTENEAEEFEYMSLICNTPKKLLNRNLMTVDERSLNFLMEVAPDLKESLYKVKFVGKRYKDPLELFSPILTSDGVCYTFNLMDRSQIFKDIVHRYRESFSTNGKLTKWNIETGYSPDADFDSYPRRTLVSGIKGGLEVIFKVNHEDLDYTCEDSLQGYKITLNHPMEVPRGRQKYFRVPLDQSVIAAIKPIMMTTSKELKAYRPEERNCYFIKEKSLRFFTIYNQPNCLYECLTEFTLDNCGCVGFHMQRENSTPMCSAYKEKCVGEARAFYLASEVNKKIEDIREKSKLKREFKFSKKRDCHCLPTCTTLDFDVETSQAEWDWKKFLEVGRLNDEWKEEDTVLLNSNAHFSRLVLYFKDMQFITQERNELYGQTDFWASCGGLLGLFTGFSFLSLLEVIYYLTLRFACNVFKFGWHYWSGSKELLEKKERQEGF